MAFSWHSAILVTTLILACSSGGEQGGAGPQGEGGQAGAPCPLTGDEWVQLGSADATIYARQADGDLFCWGWGFPLSCDITIPSANAGFYEASATVVGCLDTFVGEGVGVRHDGGFVLWGGALSNVTRTASPPLDFKLGIAPGMGRAVEATGVAPVTVLDENGAVWVRGRLGDQVWNSLTRLDLPRRARALRSGDATCILDVEGFVSCFGYDYGRTLGVSHDGDILPLTELPLPFKVKEFGSSWNTSCAVAEDGALYCAGDNMYGQLGYPPGDFKYREAFEMVPGIEGVERVKMEGLGATVCALSEGQLSCWGSPFMGLFGTEETAPVPTPRLMEPFNDVIDFVVEDALCVLRENHEIWCRGAPSSLGVCEARHPIVTPDWFRVETGPCP